MMKYPLMTCLIAIAIVLSWTPQISATSVDRSDNSTSAAIMATQHSPPATTQNNQAEEAIITKKTTYQEGQDGIIKTAITLTRATNTGNEVRCSLTTANITGDDLRCSPAAMEARARNGVITTTLINPNAPRQPLTAGTKPAIPATARNGTMQTAATTANHMISTVIAQVNQPDISTTAAVIYRL